MRKGLQLATVLTIFGASCVPAMAQRHVRRAPMVISAPEGTRVIRVPSTTGIQNLDPSGTIITPVIPSSASVSSLINGGFPVPGLGFDFTHAAVRDRNLGVRALIDPVTQHQLALARDIRRETPVATPVFLPAVVNNIQVVVMSPPPVVIVQQPVEEEPVEHIERARYIERDAEPTPAVTRAPEPVTELGEIVLIRSDGTIVFAVAFSTHGERLVYVTREGIRRSFLLRELDADATRQMNEERGTSLRLPV